MHPRICVNGISSRKWTLEQDLAFYKSADVHTAVVPFAKIASDPAAGAKTLLATDFTVALLGGNAVTPLMGGLDALKAPIDTARAVNCPCFYSISGATPEGMSTDEAYFALVEALQPVTAYARALGVRLAIENNSVATRGHGFIHSLADCADLARAADVDICLDFQNCWYERRLPQLFRANVDRLVMVQISDFLIGEELRFNRRPPGEGSIPLDWMLQQVLDAGYEGLFDIEALGPHIEAEGYASAIERSVGWLSERFARWGL